MVVEKKFTYQFKIIMLEKQQQNGWNQRTRAALFLHYKSNKLLRYTSRNNIDSDYT